jgi:hypothetical protein
MRINDVVIENNQMLDEFGMFDRGIGKALEKKGYQVLGAGVDQEAYLEPGGKTVLKIFGTQGNSGKLSPDQRMFVRWAEFCQRNSDNPFLPRYSGWEPFDYKGETYLQIRTELLREPQTPQERKLVNAIAELGAAFDSHGISFLDLEKNKLSAPSYQIVKKAVGEDNVPLLLNTLLELIHTTQTKKKYLWDLHSGNIMLRPNGQVVLNDPYVLDPGNRF